MPSAFDYVCRRFLRHLIKIPLCNADVVLFVVPVTLRIHIYHQEQEIELKTLWNEIQLRNQVSE